MSDQAASQTGSATNTFWLPSWIAGGTTVAVAMSGGVDSTTAVSVLCDAGCEVVGLHMRVWDKESKRTARACAEQLNIAYHELDLRVEFLNEVVNPFIDDYLQGSTPNPCVGCNRKFKFAKLRDYAESLGISIIATGHYAQVKEVSCGVFGLYTGKDRAKDQSYFLYSLTQQELSSTLFPLGAFTKPVIRQAAGHYGFDFSEDEDSQDVCFVDVPVAEFIETRRAVGGQGGVIVNAQGEPLGTHLGVHRYTIGQRRGLGIAAEHPLYVTGLDAKTRTVTVGAKHDLERGGLYVRSVNWGSGQVPTAGFRALVKLRYRHPGVYCDVEPIGQDEARLRFVSDWSAVSPGQSAVFYGDEDAAGDRVVIGGGIIERGED
jgi:tRNA-specific 2-thiouridylase